jgi:hypothetical protein
MQRPTIDPNTFLKYLSDEDLMECIEVGELERLCNAMTIDFALLKEGTNENQA